MEWILKKNNGEGVVYGGLQEEYLCILSFRDGWRGFTTHVSKLSVSQLGTIGVQVALTVSLVSAPFDIANTLDYSRDPLAVAYLVSFYMEIVIKSPSYFLRLVMTFWIFSLISCLSVVSGIYSDVPSVKIELINPRADAERKKAEYLSLEDLSSQYDAFLLDAYGVFWGSSEVGVLPGAAHAMAYLIDQGKVVGILSNSTQPAVKEKEKLRKHGLFEGIHYHFLLTSGEVAKDLLAKEALPFPTPRNTYCLFGSVHPRFGSHVQLFEGTKYREVDNFQEADFIYISIPHVGGVDQEDPELFRKMVQSVQQPLPILCVNPDRFAMEGSPPRLVVRQGSIAQMFVEQQADVYLIGKPSQIIYEAALRYIPSEIAREKILMIGDTPETDIRGAHGVGLDGVLVTKTGVMTHLLEKQGEATVIRQLPPSDQPDFLLERLSLGF